MKVLRNDLRGLEARHRSGLVRGLGIALLLSGGLSGLFLDYGWDVACEGEAGSGQCRVTHIDLTSGDVREVAFNALKKAEYIRNEDEEGGATCQVALVDESGTDALFATFIDCVNGLDELASELDVWAQGGAEGSVHTRLWGFGSLLLVVGGLLFAGAWCLRKSPSIRLELDRPSGVLTVTHGGPLRRRRVRTYGLALATGVRVESYGDDETTALALCVTYPNESVFVVDELAPMGAKGLETVARLLEQARQEGQAT